MENHIFILSTMTPDITNAALPFDFNTQVGTIQKFEWDKVTTIWIACQHPVINCMAESIIPYMDICLVWYHNHCALSCLQVHNCMHFLEKYHQNISLMTTIKPPLLYQQKSKVRHYYNKHGFVRKYYYEDFKVNISRIKSTLRRF